MRLGAASTFNGSGKVIVIEREKLGGFLYIQSDLKNNDSDREEEEEQTAVVHVRGGRHHVIFVFKKKAEGRHLRNVVVGGTHRTTTGTQATHFPSGSPIPSMVDHKGPFVPTTEANLRADS